MLRHQKTYEFVVVGTGAGGAVIAKELAEAGHSVLIIERGQEILPEHRQSPAYLSVRNLYADGGFTWAYGNSLIALPHGNVVGGTTAINSATCFRTPNPIHENWVNQFGLVDFSYEKMADHYSAVEHEIHAESCDWDIMNPSNQFIGTASKRAGLTGAPLVRNAIGCDGCGMCCYGCTTQKKQSTDRTYIPKALHAGAEIYTRCEVLQINHRNGHAESIRIKHLETNSIDEIFFKNLIISAGTFSTPILLKRSRIRPSPHLGRHLAVHPASKVYAEFSTEIKSWQGIPQAYAIESYREQGILFEGVFMPPEIAASMNPYVGNELRQFMENYAKIMSYGFLIEDSSEGRLVDLPFVGRSIFYSLNQTDVDRIQLGTSVLARLFLENGAKRVITMIDCEVREFLNIEDVQKFESLKLKPNQIEVAAFHPLGTARMSSFPNGQYGGVVNPNFQVFGFDNLYICDGSILPSSLGVNPQLTIMAFAHKLSKQLA